MVEFEESILLLRLGLVARLFCWNTVTAPSESRRTGEIGVIRSIGGVRRQSLCFPLVILWN